MYKKYHIGNGNIVNGCDGHGISGEVTAVVVMVMVDNDHIMIVRSWQ